VERQRRKKKKEREEESEKGKNEVKQIPIFVSSSSISSFPLTPSLSAKLDKIG